MKIEVKERDVNYYDEIMFIGCFIKKIVANPFNKVKGLSKHYKMYSICWGCVTLLYLILTFATKFEGGFIYIFWFSLVFFIISMRGVIQTKKTLRRYSQIDNVSTFEITDDLLSITSFDETMVSIKWDSVRNILISKYSIVFIPKDNVNFLMTVSIKYFDEVMKIIHKLKKDDLIIDNRNLYK